LKGKGKLSRKIAWTTLCFGLAIGLAGCRHKPQLAPLPPILTPVALEDIPEPDNLPMVEVTPVRLPPVPVSADAGKPKRKKKQPPKAIVPPEPVPETQVAAATPSPEETAIGALTAGGETNPQTKQEAADLIASIEKRLNALSTQKAEEQKAQVSKVRNFWKEAQEALKSGDAEGAKTLAIKAKLLLDDLEK
jgi:ribosomal protein S20